MCYLVRHERNILYIVDQTCEPISCKAAGIYKAAGDLGWRVNPIAINRREACLGLTAKALIARMDGSRRKIETHFRLMTGKSIRETMKAWRKTALESATSTIHLRKMI